MNANLKTIFNKAHEAARRNYKFVGDYHLAFTLALREIYNTLKALRHNVKTFVQARDKNELIRELAAIYTLKLFEVFQGSKERAKHLLQDRPDEFIGQCMDMANDDPRIEFDGDNEETAFSLFAEMYQESRDSKQFDRLLAV